MNISEFKAFAVPALVPALVAGVFLLLSWRPWQRKSLPGRGHWGGALGLAGAYIAGQILIEHGLPHFPIVGSYPWLLFLAPGAAVIGLFEGFARPPDWIKWPLRCVLTGATISLLARINIENEIWNTQQGLLWITGLSGALLLFWGSLDLMSEKHSGRTGIFVMGLVAAVGAVVLGLSGSAKYGQLEGAVAAGLGVYFIIALFNPQTSIARGATGVLAITLGGLWVEGWLWSELNPVCAVLLVLAPFCSLVVCLGRLGNLAGFKRGLLAVMAAMIPLTAATLYAWHLRPPPYDPYSYEIELDDPDR